MSKETPNGMIHNNFSVNTTIVGNINAASDISTAHCKGISNVPGK